MELTDKDFEKIDLVERVVFDYFGVEYEQVIKKDTSNRVSQVRNMLYHILHEDFNISVSKIAYRYKRKDRGVKFRLADMRFNAKQNGALHDVHSMLLKRIEGNE